MPTIQRKIESVLDSAESSLGDLVQSALRQKSYDDIGRLVEALAHLEKVRQALNLPQSKRASIGQDMKVSKRASEVAIEKKSGSPLPDTKLKIEARRGRKQENEQSATNYPKFLKDESRLIKVGWSRKKKAEYMHRVPKEAIYIFAEHLEKNVGAQSLFEIENLFPILAASGEEIPGYQIYVIIAWLRTVGTIVKKGRDGYIIQKNTGLRGEINELWTNLQQYA